ncbi:hypothetical protein M0R45_005423 [Rubus argutus]|uniref:Bulb-type lectin domain-containing protein n=1 Tax=Rubus argutus TaxID=59490 RepID=A0AAW1YMU1_RUBAR
MAFVVGCLLAFAFILNAKGQPLQSNISPGSSLTPTSKSSWLSRSGRYAFGFYKQANDYAVGIVLLSGIPEKTVVWTANRDEPLVSNNAILALHKGRDFIAVHTRANFSGNSCSVCFFCFNA